MPQTLDADGGEIRQRILASKGQRSSFSGQRSAAFDENSGAGSAIPGRAPSL